jgi:hypothetical protein
MLAPLEGLGDFVEQAHGIISKQWRRTLGGTGENREVKVSLAWMPFQ